MPGFLLYNAHVHTMVPGSYRPGGEQAIAWADGRVLAVGSYAAVAQYVSGYPGGVKKIDAGGRAVFPGFNDAHTHAFNYGQSLEQVDLDGVADLTELARRLLAAAGEREWVLGRGWDKATLFGGDWPPAGLLDRILPGRKVLLASKDGHSAWASRAAMTAAGVGPGTPDPAGGEIVREKTGMPTGVFKENATELVWRAVPPPGPAERQRYARLVIDDAYRRGLVGIHDNEDAVALAAFGDLAAAGELRFRVVFNPPLDTLPKWQALGVRSGFGNRFLRLGAIKAFADGALGSHTALMIEPYESQPENRGVATMSRQELEEAVETCTQAGFPVAIHAIGDQAIRNVLDAIEKVGGVHGTGYRHRIEHAQAVHPDDVPRFARLGVVASVQPIHATSDRDRAERFWGRRVSYAYGYRSLVSQGAHVCLGSDVPVEPWDPLAGLYAAVARKDVRAPGREPWHAEQALSMWDAISGYTREAAYAVGDETWRGTLSPGMAADLVVLSQDLFALEPDAIPTVQVEATVVDGEVVFSRGWL